MILKKYGLIFVLVFFCSGVICAEDFKWVRGKYKVVMPAQEEWDCWWDVDLNLIKEIPRYTTIKVEEKIHTVTFEDLDEMIKYPLIFMTASQPPVFSEKEIKNLREYLNRGGMIFADDHHEGGGRGDEFYVGFRQIIEQKIFPGRKFETIPLDSQIYHCHFELPTGWPVCAGKEENVPLGLFHEKDKHLMVIINGTSLQSGWAPDHLWPLPVIKKRQAIKAAINLIVYSMTH